MASWIVDLQTRLLESTVNMLYLVAAVLVEQYQYESHHHDHTDHDGGIEDGIDSTLAHSVSVFTERSVDAAWAKKFIVFFHLSWLQFFVSWLARNWGGQNSNLDT